jgi:hypothetical protein
MELSMPLEPHERSFLRNRRGVAALEFALIAPALIFLVMGVFEMSFRFRASEEATRYVHQIADLVSRETNLTTDAIGVLHDASVNMMAPLDTSENLDLDVASIGFEGEDATPTILWRRVAGSDVDFDPDDVAGMGVQDESVIHVSIRYNYQSVLSELFGGGSIAIEKFAIARPRVERRVAIDGQTSEPAGAIVYVNS